MNKPSTPGNESDTCPATNQEKSDRYGYSPDIQKKIAAMLLFNDQALVNNFKIIKPQYFDYHVLQDMVLLEFMFFERYQRRALPSEYLELLDQWLTKDNRLSSEEYLDIFEELVALWEEGNFEFARDLAIDFAQYQRTKNALIESVDLLQKKKDYPGIRRKIMEATDSNIEGDNEELVCITVADVEEKEVDWLMPGRVAYDELTIWGGNPGAGKSHLAMWLAAHISAGIPWETDPTTAVEQGSVLILNTEDSVESSIKLRLRVNGADQKRCHVIPSVLKKDSREERLFSLTRDLDKLKKKMDEIGDVRLVIIDLLDNFLGTGVDSNKATDISAVIAPLKRFAEQNHIAILGILHLNKNQQTDFLYRLLGSVKLIGIPRVVEFITKDKKDSRIRYFQIAKNNHDIVKQWEDLKFAFHKEGDGKIIIDMDAEVPPIEDQLSPETKEQLRENRIKKEAAIAILRDVLMRDSSPEVVPASDVQHAHPDIYPNAWVNARRELGVRTFVKDGVWWWELKGKR